MDDELAFEEMVPPRSVCSMLAHNVPTRHSFQVFGRPSPPPSPERSTMPPGADASPLRLDADATFDAARTLRGSPARKQPITPTICGAPVTATERNEFFLSKSVDSRDPQYLALPPAGDGSDAAAAPLAVLATGEAASHAGPLRSPRPAASTDDFELLCVLGMGAFGRVLQVRYACGG